MAQGSEEHQGSSFGGVSLPSFLQMLEQERKSCTLIVNSEGRSGSFYFEDGELIDAVFDDRGLPASDHRRLQGVHVDAHDLVAVG